MDQNDQNQQNEWNEPAQPITPAAEPAAAEDVPHQIRPPVELPEENVLAGLAGALLFSLAGGIIWFLLYQIGMLAGISGFIGVICAIKGYSVFGKRESVKGIVLSTVIAMLVLVFAEYFCLAKEYYDACVFWFQNGELLEMPGFFDCVRAAVYLLEDPEICGIVIRDLAIGLLLAVVGCIAPIRAAARRVKEQKNAQG